LTDWADRLAREHFRGGKTRRTATDDHDLSGRIGRRLAARLRHLTFSPDEDAAALLFDLPDRERAQRRRACRLPSAQIEAGMMPGTTDAVSDDEPLGQGTVIMAAMRIDRKHLGSDSHQQDVLVADMPQQGLAGEITRRDALGEIGSGG
jgi:hypothetical protein